MSYLTLWMILGVILLVAEMLTGTFVLVFIALGCFIAALVAITAPLNLVAQITACTLVALLGVFALRKPLQRKLLKSESFQADIGQVVAVTVSIPAQQENRINYQGTTWSAKNVDDTDLNAGDHALIVGLDGHTLLLKKQ